MNILNKNRYASMLIFVFIISALNGCKKDIDPIADDPAIVAIIENEDDKANATIVTGCFEFEKKDTFSILLDEYPDGVTAVYPSTSIPDTLRIDGQRVAVSGTVFDTKAVNQCDGNSETANKFQITEINKPENTVEMPQKLKGTKWKLECIVNVQTNEIQALEPFDCEQCYNLEFDTDSTATGKAVYENIVIDLSLLGKYSITDIMREPNEEKFIRSLYSENTKFYSVTANYLKFINDKENYYLLFKKLPQ
jgi:hypothetical protein